MLAAKPYDVVAAPWLVASTLSLSSADAPCPALKWSALTQGPHLEKAVPTNGTLDQKEFLTDDFRINSFKVTPRNLA